MTTRKQPNIPDGVKSVKPARLEQRVEMAENPWRQEGLPQFIVEADAFALGCERQHPISTALERRRIVGWLKQRLYIEYVPELLSKKMVYKVSGAFSKEGWEAFVEGTV